MDQQSGPAPKFYILCPDRTILESFRTSNRLFLALQWHTPHMARCLTSLSPKEASLLDESHHVFGFFPLTQSDRVLHRYIDLMHLVKAKGGNFFLYTFTRSFDDHERMISHLIELVIMELAAIYGRPC